MLKSSLRTEGQLPVFPSAQCGSCYSSGEICAGLSDNFRQHLAPLAPGVVQMEGMGPGLGDGTSVCLTSLSLLGTMFLHSFTPSTQADVFNLKDVLNYTLATIYI